MQIVNARRAWIVDQLAALIRNGAIPKDDQWVQTILDWFAVHGLFTIKKKSDKAKFIAVRIRVPRACRHRALFASYLTFPCARI